MDQKTTQEGRLSRPVVFALAGVVVIVVAIGMSVWSSRRDENASAPQKSNPPAAAPSTAPVQSPAATPAAPSPSGAANETKPAPAAPDSVPSFDVVRVANNGQTVMAGRAAPGATVIILDGDKEIGRVTADAQGEWVFTPNRPLPPGSQELSLRAEDKGGTVQQGDAPVVLVVPERTQTASADSNANNEALAIKVQPGGEVKILQVPTSKEAAGAVSIEVVNYDDKGHLAVAGRAPAQAAIQIYLDNAAIGNAAADAKGAWNLSLQHQLPDGNHTVRADQIGADGKVLARAEISFASGGSLPKTGNVTVATGNSLWRIARRAYGSGFDYIVIYQANKEQIRNPDLIYPGQTFKLPTKG